MTSTAAKTTHEDAARFGFDPQRAYSEMVADATVVCPNFYLASSWQVALAAQAAATTTRARRTTGVTSTTTTSTSANTPTAPLHPGVVAYRATQSLSHPFCVLRDTRFSPPYCPRYAFHASDMFAWLRPNRTTDFPYTFSEADEAYGSLINARFRAVVHGETPRSWEGCTGARVSTRDALPPDFTASELHLPDAPMVPGERDEACALWLGAGWYERIGLIN
jgi:hypothetical protein